MLAVLILLHLQKALTAALDNYPLQGEILRSLDDWERASLRDFVRGKGRGSVSRIPVELLNEPPPALDAMHEDNIVSLMTPPESAIRAGPMMTVPRDALKSLSIAKKVDNFRLDDRSVASVISPASKVKRKPVTSTSAKATRVTWPYEAKASKQFVLQAQKGIKTSLDEPSQETFKELSGLLQTFIDRRKPLVQRVTMAPSTTTTFRTWTQVDKAEDTTAVTSSLGQWEAMGPEETSMEEFGPSETEGKCLLLLKHS
ncbi:unnamed protein product [Cylicostephanus goldi]|uniref:Uncharacterized protein n=1 Tax=Cylicostephanus goldi TaxID=71465 RepID=A0A3P6Q8W4_CYLGO|nr:unnamed protein product [Cylicostephanus goldi]